MKHISIYDRIAKQFNYLVADRGRRMYPDAVIRLMLMINKVSRNANLFEDAALGAMLSKIENLPKAKKAFMFLWDTELKEYRIILSDSKAGSDFFDNCDPKYHTISVFLECYNG